MQGGTGSEGSGWPAVLDAVLASWYGEETPNLNQFSGSSRRFIETLSALDESRRPELLATLRQRLDALPSDRIHDSWLITCLPQDPLLRSWCLGTLTAPTRSRLTPWLQAEHQPVQDSLDQKLPESLRGGMPDVPMPQSPEAPVAAMAPDWVGDWWRAEIRRHIDYPMALPWEIDAKIPVSFLYRLTAEEASSFLSLIGLRPLAAGLRGLEEREIVRLFYQLPPLMQQTLMGRAKEALPEEAPWTEVLREHLEGKTEPRRISAELAVEDLTVQASSMGRAEDLERLAYRLSMPAGKRLLAKLRSPRESIRNKDLDGWNRALLADYNELVAEGSIVPPDLQEETWV